MRKINLCFILLFIPLLFSTMDTHANGSHKKYALIVAIAHYPAGTGWQNISSDKDVALIKTTLENQKFDEIKILADSQATREGIVNAILEMKAKVKKGDVALIHFSSHGQQIFDDNGDESDNLDETIVAYGAPSRYYAGYKGEKHLRDDEIGELLDGIRAKVGKSGDVIVFMDACHSGSGTRGEGKVRGGVEPLVPEGFVASKKEEEGSGNFNFKKTTRGGESDMAPLVVFSAARSNELNYEYKGCGSLSYAISKVFSSTNKEVSYRGIFSKLLSVMSSIAPNQNPVIEGDGIDRELFGGNSVAQESYYTIKEIKDNEIIINGGKLNGIYEGSSIEFFPEGTNNTKNKQALLKGIVNSSDYFTSTVKIDTSAKIKNKSDAWAFVKEFAFPDNAINIFVNEFSKSGLKSAITNSLKELSYVKLLDKDGSDVDLTISEQGKNSNSVKLINAETGAAFQENISVADNNFEKLVNSIQGYIQAKTLKGMDLTDAALDVEIELLPVKTKKEGSKTIIVDTLAADSKDNNGIIEFKEGESAIIKVTNKGNEPAYFNIVDVQPDGIINPLIPNLEKNEDGSGYLIKPGASYIVSNRIVTFYPPFGTELFKVFATREPVNLNPIITNRRAAPPKNPLEKLFQNSMNVNTRGAKMDTSGSLGNTFDYVFRIVK